jgi:pyruvyltransferase
MFKYEDYYHSTGRYNFPIASTVEEALEITPAPLPDLKPLQRNLIQSFPVDLWAKCVHAEHKQNEQTCITNQ